MVDSSAHLVVFSANGHRWGFPLAAVDRIEADAPRDRVVPFPFTAGVAGGRCSIAFSVNGNEHFVIVDDDVAVVEARLMPAPVWLELIAKRRGWRGFALTDDDASPVIVLDHEQLVCPPEGEEP
jgi:hypothetical protein